LQKALDEAQLTVTSYGETIKKQTGLLAEAESLTEHAVAEAGQAQLRLEELKGELSEAHAAQDAAEKKLKERTAIWECVKARASSNFQELKGHLLAKCEETEGQQEELVRLQRLLNSVRQQQVAGGPSTVKPHKHRQLSPSNVAQIPALILNPKACTIGAPAVEDKTEEPSSGVRWKCDFCAVQFETFNEAERHEEVCPHGRLKQQGGRGAHSRVAQVSWSELAEHARLTTVAKNVATLLTIAASSKPQRATAPSQPQSATATSQPQCSSGTAGFTASCSDLGARHDTGPGMLFCQNEVAVDVDLTPRKQEMLLKRWKKLDAVPVDEEMRLEMEAFDMEQLRREEEDMKVVTEKANARAKLKQMSDAEILQRILAGDM